MRRSAPGSLRWVVAILGATGGSASCDRDATTAPASAASSTAPQPVEQPHLGPRREPYADDPLADEADYAQSAERDITEANYRAKLAELEREEQRDRADGGAADASAPGPETTSSGAPGPAPVAPPSSTAAP